MTEKASKFKKYSGLFFMFLGFVILGILLYNLDFQVIIDSFNKIGWKIFYVFGIAIIWITFNTLCIYTLVNRKVPFLNLVYNQVTGDGYNVITPFAGLGGEPYKIKHLTKWLPLDVASKSIMRDRLLHSLSGILFTSLTTWCVILFLPLERSLFITFTVMGSVLAVASFLFSYLILSDAPERLLGTALKKLKLLENFRKDRFRKSTFFKALFFKMMGRISNMLEFVVIFWLLGATPSVLDIITINAMLALSGTIFFIIPQGIGVNEGGISWAFKLIGRSIEMGASVGLIRRARVLFWALLGVALHLGYLGLKQLGLVGKKANLPTLRDQ